MQDTDAPHETDDPTPSAACGAGDGLESEPMGDDQDLGLNGEISNLDVVHCNMLEDHDTTQQGEASLTQARESMDGISQEGPVVSVDVYHITADPVPEQPYGSGSKSTSKPNQGGKASGRSKGRKYRKGGSVKVLEIRSSPSQLVKPYGHFADQSSEDNQENGSSIKKQARRTPAAANDLSTARRPSVRGDGERPHGTPGRRLAFAPVLPSELNIRMGTAPSQTPEKYTPSKTVATSNSVTSVQISTTTPLEEELASPVWSLQQTGSTTAQVLTNGDESDPTSEYVEEKLSVSAISHYDEEETIEAALERQSALIYGHDDSSDHHDSDKENVPVHERFVLGPSNMTWKLQTSGSCVREPLQTLYSAPSPSMSQSPDIFTTPASQGLVRARFQAEAGQQWQMVVDTSCLLEVESLESIKLLEGIRETRLVIPNTVLRELDYLRKQDDRKARACSVLQWIEACMLKIPSWIHVQSSGNNVQVAMTPSVSPSLYSGLPSCVSESDMMHPTLHDHVLEYALFLQRMLIGRVSILTDDTTLKIKALAEGLVVDTAIKFSDSLLNPYSDRFLYVGSTPVGRSSMNRLHQELYDGLSTPGTAISSSKWLTPAGRPTSRPDTPRPSSRANFSTWRKSQPLGLQALLQQCRLD